MKWLLSIFSVCLLISCQNINDDSLYAFTDPDTGLWGFKTQSGQVIIKPQYHFIYEPNTEKQFFKTTTHHFVFKGQGFFAINKKGEKLFEGYWFDNGPDDMEEGVARYIENNKVGFHDEKANIVLPAAYDWATPFKNGISIVCNGCYGRRLDTKTYPASYCCQTKYKNESYTEIIGGKWGAIDKSGQLIIPLKYDFRKQVETDLKENLKS